MSSLLDCGDSNMFLQAFKELKSGEENYGIIYTGLGLGWYMRCWL